jgi:hypothetical protein
MRRVATIPCCLAFVTAFVLAPFQHVHHGHEPGHDHGHAPLVHSHLSPHHHDHVDVPGRAQAAERSVVRDFEEPEIESADDDDQPVSLDTFTLVLTTHVAPFIPTRMPVIALARTETSTSFEVVEERGNGPPPLRRAPPRAPPV